MNTRLLLGVVLPLFLVVVLVMLSVLHPGLSITHETIDFLDIEEFSDYGYEKIQVQTITVRNDHFIPLKYDLPSYVVCAVDDENDDRKGFKVEFSRSESALDLSAGETEVVHVFVRQGYVKLNQSQYDAMVLVEKDNFYYNPYYWACDNIDIDEGFRIPLR